MAADDRAPAGSSGELARFFKFLAEAEKTGMLPRRGRRESDSFAFVYQLFQQFSEAGLDKETKAAQATGRRPPEQRPELAKTPSEVAVHPLREPVADLFDEPDEVVLVYELPGVARKDIRYRRDGDILRLEAETPEWLYRKSVIIEAKLADRPPRLRLRNGVLELRLLKDS